MEGKIICAFYGSGKTYLAKTLPNFIDIEFYLYKNHTDLLLKIIKEYTKVYGYNVLIASDPIVMDLLTKNNLEFTVVIPTIEQKEEYKKRYAKRGNPEEIVEYLASIFEKRLKLAEGDYKKIYLKENEYLIDVLKEVV